MSMTFSSPNRIIWRYFNSLRRIVGRLDGTDVNDELKQDVAIAIMLAVTVVDAFLNVYFRVVVSEAGFSQHEKKFLDELEKRKSLSFKLNQWPGRILGKKLDYTQEMPRRFEALRQTRNELIHFKSNHQSISLPAIDIRGLADTTVFDSLTAADAGNALDVAEGMLCEIFRLRGIPEADIPRELQSWTGKVPA